MGSSIAQAKVHPVSWDALEKLEPFTAAVKQQLAAAPSTCWAGAESWTRLMANRLVGAMRLA